MLGLQLVIRRLGASQTTDRNDDRPIWSNRQVGEGARDLIKRNLIPVDFPGQGDIRQVDYRVGGTIPGFRCDRETRYA